MLGFLTLLALGLALYWGALVVWVAFRLTHPPRRSYAWAVAYAQPGDPMELDEPRTFEEGEARAAGETITYWSIEGDDPDAPMFVFTHGWGESKQGVLTRLGGFAPIASSVVAWDLPGHGESSGWCRLGAREARTLVALLDALDPPGAGVVLAGFSLGAGVSVAAGALEERAARAEGRVSRVVGVIAEAPYRVPWTPAAQVLRQLGVPPGPVLAPALWVVGVRAGLGPRWRGFDRAPLARELGCPVLVLHGSEDAMCPPHDGRAIAEASRLGSFEEIAGVGHIDMWGYGASRRNAAHAIEVMVRERIHGAEAEPGNARERAHPGKL